MQYLEFLAADDTARKELTAARMSRGWCIGDKPFQEGMRKAAAQAGADLERFAGLEPEAVTAEREQRWEEQLRALARAAEIDLAELPEGKSHPHKAQLAAAMKAMSSVTNAWLARRLEMGQPASASQFARRWMLDEERRRAVEALVSRVKT